ncbi:hypothetical protein HDU78_003977 [Chytriomyces hyalinus]|nr:hypothetical protein HDU78_003977 [Chytriomyces hyalinus]
MSAALAGFLTLELTRAVLTEGMYATASGASRRPLLHAQVVILAVEVVRVAAACCMIISEKRKPKLHVHALKSVGIQTGLWFVNNCIYFNVLSHASVATVSILMQLRLPITGILHHFLVRKQSSLGAWIALIVIYVGVVCAQWSNSFSISDMWTIIACLVLSILSSIASIVSEKMLKGANMPFWDQQLQVCALSVVSSSVFLVAMADGPWINYDMLNTVSVAFTTGSVLAAAGAGLFTGLVVRHLDSVVKLIAQSVAAVSTTVLVYLLFGTFKAIFGMFVVGAVLLVLGTALYALETTTNPNYARFRNVYRLSGKETKENIGKME